MKIMKRIKDILFDEEEVEIPVIEEKHKTTKIIENNKDDSIKEIKMPEEDFSDKETLKSELTFPFPIEFDEDELAKTKPIETVRKQVEPERTREREYNSYNRYEVKREEYKPRPEREIKDYSSYLRTKEEKKQFKPTPIISPVYGVLDQNYKKEDVILKNEIKREPINTNSKLDLDEIRKKAYGEEKEIEVEPKEVEIIEDEFIELDPNKSIGELYEESINIEEFDHNIEEPKKIIDIIDEEETPTVELSDLIAEKENVEKKLASSIADDDDETDLFSLIDSMYEENNE